METAGSDRGPGIGIDFGTTNSTAAIYDGSRLTLVALQQGSAIMPSALYIDRDYQTLTGQEAIDAYIERNQGRRVEMSLEVLGEARSGTGQIDMETELPTVAETHLVYGQAFNDSSLPGRLFRSSKRLLANPDIRRIMVFDRPFRLVALITPLLLRIRRTVTETLKLPSPAELSHACIGHPVNFEGGGGERNQVALERLDEACSHAGIRSRRFYPEPAAAALSYLHGSRGQDNRLVLTVDFGGGTLDLCILRRSGDSFEVAATHGIGLGGDHIDQCLFRALLFPLLGKGERWRRDVEGHVVETLFPFDDYEELLLNWPVSYMLNQNRYTTPVLDKIRQGGPDAPRFQRLYDLITQNTSYQVFQAIKDCKARLSDQEQALLDIPEIDVSVRITREQFEAMIAAQLAVFEETVQETLRRSGLEHEAIDLVLSTGGSSLIPAVRRILERQFPERVVEHDPFTSVAAGLAIADYMNGNRRQTGLFSAGESSARR